MNTVILSGNIGTIRDLKHLGADKAVIEFSLATRRWGGGTDTPDWHTIQVWGKQAENCAQYLEIGQWVGVEGSIQYNQWEKEGVKHERTIILANRVEFGPKPNRPARKTELPSMYD